MGKEDSSQVNRVHAKVMKDGIEGYITVAGTQGSIFLEDGGSVFKVKQETILTDSFELMTDAAKDSARKLKDTTRKLKPNELVDVYEWPKKEEKSGLMRMRCKAKSDGACGWATTVGNEGKVFMEAI